MERTQFEKATAVLTATLALAIGASACDVDRDEPIKVPITAVRMGVMPDDEFISNVGNGDDLGFMFRGNTIDDIGLIDCSNHNKDIVYQPSGSVVVICENASDATIIKVTP